MLGLKLRSKPFDFIKHIESCGFVVEHEFYGAKFFKKGNYIINMYFSKKTTGHDLVNFDFINKNIASLKFIPKTKILTDCILKQVSELQEEV